jgi:hypothetical protein
MNSNYAHDLQKASSSEIYFYNGKDKFLVTDPAICDRRQHWYRVMTDEGIFCKMNSHIH